MILRLRSRSLVRISLLRPCVHVLCCRVPGRMAGEWPFALSVLTSPKTSLHTGCQHVPDEAHSADSDQLTARMYHADVQHV